MIEALGFCQNIFVMKFTGWEYMEDFLDSPNFSFFEHTEDVVDAVEKENKSHTIGLENYFAKNA